MSRRSLLFAGLVALAACVAWPQQSQAQYGGCSTCATVPAYQPMVVRYGLFGRPRAVYYAPTVAAAPVAPVAAYYAPVAAAGCSTCPTATYYAPAAPACSTCPTCPTGGCGSACNTCYSPTIVSVPVTTYRPVAACGPCGNTVTVMRPVTSYVQRVQYAPQTVCSPCSTVSYSPVSCAPGCTGCSACSPGTCGPNCTGCSQCAPATSQPQYAPQPQPQYDPNGYAPQTQPGYGQQQAAPQTFQSERPQTSPAPTPAPQPQPQTSAPQQPIPYHQPHTSGSNYAPGNPQLIDPESRTTQAPRSWNFHRAVAQENDLAARIIPVSQPAPQAAPQNDGGWRAAQPR